MIAASPTVTIITSATHADIDPLAAKAAGVAFVAVVSAVFWMAIVGLTCSLLGIAVSAKLLMTLGATTALFLTAVCAPLMLRT